MNPVLTVEDIILAKKSLLNRESDIICNEGIIINLNIDQSWPYSDYWSSHNYYKKVIFCAREARLEQFMMLYSFLLSSVCQYEYQKYFLIMFNCSDHLPELQEFHLRGILIILNFQRERLFKESMLGHTIYYGRWFDPIHLIYSDDHLTNICSLLVHNTN